MKLIFLLSVVFVFRGSVFGDEQRGTVIIRFRVYDNSRGSSLRSKCCDKILGMFCQKNGCDHLFKICLSETRSTCDLGYKQTSATKNRNYLHFRTRIGNTPNPISFPLYRKTQHSVELRVTSWDHDYKINRDDFIDDLKIRLPALYPNDRRRQTMRHRTRLEIETTLKCNKFWHGLYCGVYCLPSWSHTCDFRTGRKICHPDYTGTECNILKTTKRASTTTRIVLTNEGTVTVSGSTQLPSSSVSGTPSPTANTNPGSGSSTRDMCEITCLPGNCSRSANGPYCNCPTGFIGTFNNNVPACIFQTSSSTATSSPSASSTFQRLTSSVRTVSQGGSSTQISSSATGSVTTLPPSSLPSATPSVVILQDRENIDCDRLAQKGFRYQSGVYIIHPSSLKPFPVWCDMSSRGWTVIQRRVDGSLNFFQNWTDYQRGFGSIGANTEYWIGLERIYHLTNQRDYRLRITLQMADRTFRYAEYKHFRIGSEAEGYAIHVSGFSGNAGDAFEDARRDGRYIQNGMKFSTYDRDNDGRDGWTPARLNNCAELFRSGWWFNSCFSSNLNGIYIKPLSGFVPCPQQRCVAWRTVTNSSLIRTEMEILPHDFHYNSDISRTAPVPRSLYQSLYGSN